MNNATKIIYTGWNKSFIFKAYEKAVKQNWRKFVQKWSEGAYSKQDSSTGSIVEERVEQCLDITVDILSRSSKSSRFLRAIKSDFDRPDFGRLIISALLDRWRPGREWMAFVRHNFRCERVKHFIPIRFFGFPESSSDRLSRSRFRISK